MKRQEALKIAEKLGLDLSSLAGSMADRLLEALEERGLQIGLDNVTGDWVVLDADQSVLCRVE